MKATFLSVSTIKFAIHTRVRIHQMSKHCSQLIRKPAPQPVEQPAPVGNVIFEEMQYYQPGDLIFLQFDDFFWPGKVLKVIENYSRYKVMLFVLKICYTFPFARLIDYSEETAINSQELFALHDREKNVQEQFGKAMLQARHSFSRLRRKEGSQKKEEVTKRTTHNRRKNKQTHQELRQELPLNDHVSQKNSDKSTPKSHSSPPHLPIERSRKISKKDKGAPGHHGVSENLNSAETQPPVCKATKRESKAAQKVQPVGKEANDQKKSLTVQLDTLKSKKESSSQSKALKQRKPMNREFSLYLREPEPELILPRKPTRQFQELSEDDRNMVIYMARYEEVQEEQASHLDALPAIPEEGRVKIFQSAMDKLMAALVDSRTHLNGPCYLPLFRAIFQRRLISVERMAAGAVLPRPLMFLNACRQITPVPFPMELQFFTELLTDLRVRYVLGEECHPQTRAKLQEVFRMFGFSP